MKLMRKFIELSCCRHASTHAVSRPSIRAAALEHTKLVNGIAVTSLENYIPVSRIAISAKAGSRYETDENRGSSHVLRVMTGLRTNDTTAVTMTRHLQQLGASLSCTVNRDTVSYNLTCLRDTLPKALSYLKEAALTPLFRQWELDDNTWRLTHDIALLEQNHEAMVMEGLHEAAYRSGLANSIYCPKCMVGCHTTEMMREYVKGTFSSGSMAVSGLGIGHEELVEFAGSLACGSGAATAPSSSYRGGEVRKPTKGRNAHVAVAMQRSGYNNMKETIALATLEHILGLGSRVKYGKGLGSRLGDAAAKVSAEGPVSVGSLHTCYEGSGLFGYAACVPAESAAQVVKALSDEVKSIAGGNITDKELQTAKTKVKSEMFSIPSDDMIDLMAMFSLSGEFLEFQDAVNRIDSLSLQEVKETARRVLGGKASMAAVGNIDNVPFLDQL